MSRNLDHILWATPWFDSGVDLIERLTGIRPRHGGSHPGLGTQNALLGLGDKCYLEVIGPDPSQNVPGGLGERLAALAHPQIFASAVRAADLSATAAVVREIGLSTDGPVAMERRADAGRALRWHVLMTADAEFGLALPFFIDWATEDHPAETAPAGCELSSFEILHPSAPRLSGLLARLSIDIPASLSSRGGFIAELATPNGRLVLTGA